MQTDGVLDVLHGLFVGIPLAVAALQRGTGDEIAVRVCFHNDGKDKMLHDQIIGPVLPCAKRFPELHAQ